MKSIAVIKGAALESALDLEMVKADLRISGTQLDDVLSGQYIPGAIEWAEGATGRVMVARQLQWILSEFPLYTAMYLPGGNVSAVSSIAYVSNGSIVTLTGPSASPVGTDYQESLAGPLPRIMPPQGDSWPSVDSDAIDPVKVTFTAGYDSEAAVPADLKRAMVAHVYGAMELDGLLQIRPGFDMDHAEKLISAYRAPSA